MSEHSTWMGLNILGEDSRVERGGRDGRSASGYSQEQPCKRSKDGREGKGGRWATRKSRGESQGGGGGDCVTTPYSHDGFVSLATHDARKEAQAGESILWVEAEVDPTCQTGGSSHRWKTD